MRVATNQIYEMIDSGILTPEQVMDACLNFMSDSDVALMMRMNDFQVEPEETYDSEYDEEDWTVE